LQLIGKQIQWMMNLFDRLPIPKTAVQKIKTDERINSHLDVALKPYKANPEPLALKLKDAKGVWFERKSYLGKVTVINFWATWCRPCVKEIPSLNNLRQKMHGKPFELISVNYAESADVISAFLQEVNVDFPVLLDITGRISADWNVVVFPSTFVIGPDGKITYGVNAGIEWDKPDVITKLIQLMPSN
jgi:thiol-disulfide isomerase/thioredoxin